MESLNISTLFAQLFFSQYCYLAMCHPFAAESLQFFLTKLEFIKRENYCAKDAKIQKNHNKILGQKMLSWWVCWVSFHLHHGVDDRRGHHQVVEYLQRSISWKILVTLTFTLFEKRKKKAYFKSNQTKINHYTALYTHPRSACESGPVLHPVGSLAWRLQWVTAEVRRQRPQRGRLTDTEGSSDTQS